MEVSAWFSPVRLAHVGFVLALGLVAVSIEGAPLGFEANAWPSPDLLFCVIAYWSLHRPEAVPLLAVFGAGLARDLLTDTPVGAGALTLVLAAEGLKAVGQPLTRRGFGAEWLSIGGAFAAVLLAQWLMVLLVLAHPPYLLELCQQWLITLTLYPLLAAIFRWLFRVRRAKAEED